MITPVAHWTTVMQTDTDTGQVQFIAQWGGLNRARSGWHPTIAGAMAALNKAIIPHLIRPLNSIQD